MKIELSGLTRKTDSTEIVQLNNFRGSMSCVFDKVKLIFSHTLGYGTYGLQYFQILHPSL